MSVKRTMMLPDGRSGMIRHCRTRWIDTAREIVARNHPNSPSSGTMSTSGVERVSEAASRVMNVTAKTIQV